MVRSRPAFSPHKRLQMITQMSYPASRCAPSRRQEITIEVDKALAVDLERQPGKLSRHHVGIVHSSKPNSSDNPRSAVRYLSPEVRQFAILARGEDLYGHFGLIAPPPQDFADQDNPVRAKAVRQNTMPRAQNES